MTSLKQAIYTRSATGFIIKYIQADGQFKFFRKTLQTRGKMLNITVHNRQIPEVERYICTIKEYVHAKINTLS